MFQIWIYGSSYESFLVAVVNPNIESLQRWAEANEIPGDFSTICEDQRARKYILGELTKIGKENKVCLFKECILNSTPVQNFDVT